MPRLANPIAALRRFARARKGATAVEFAIVAIPMLMMVFGVLELGMVLLVSTTLDTAIDFASRDVRTGRFQNGAQTTAEAFEGKICRNMTWLAQGCESRLSVEAETFVDFGDAAQSTSADPMTFKLEDPPRCWSVGTAGDIVLVRIYYSWPLFTPLLDTALQNGPGGTRLLSTAKVFRNEPFNGDSPQGAKCN